MNKAEFELEGKIVDVEEDEIYQGRLTVSQGRIKAKERMEVDSSNYILPGLIDAHIHIESSMVPPSLFARTAVSHGTTAIVTDPHEIANVAGLTGVKYMVADSYDVPMKTYFTVPSCVPATPFETSGAMLGPDEVREMLERENFVALGEMMNYPGVLNGSKDVMKKLKVAQELGKPVDGHCPGLSGADLKKYIGAGISTDHECTQLEEAREKAEAGMTIAVRDGSASKDLDNLWPLIDEYDVFIVSDDKHPGDLLKGHINHSLKRAVELGADPLRAVKAVTINPSKHYGLDSGRMKVGSSADLVVMNSLKDFGVKKVYINGEIVAENGNAKFQADPLPFPPTVNLPYIGTDTFDTEFNPGKLRTIQVKKSSLLTGEGEYKHQGGDIDVRDEENVDMISVVSRYGNGSFAVGLVEGFSLKKGAMGSTVAHDSHNLVLVGTDSKSLSHMAKGLAVSGGMGVFDGENTNILPLEVAGLMSTKGPEVVSSKLAELEKTASRLGCGLENPFMTMSFLSLLVIPSLKISDKGLFNVDEFKFVDVKK